ncbi:SGNH/GDSL hydrolase family protein [Thalassoglobus sp.]|uniref:SGNH/GDSL hydrolase family protein n=1 Tax=Thalassoglobus sp. TaxID=2795869 RepID=UPI003AA8BB66
MESTLLDKPNRRRRWAFRCLTVALALSPFLVIELVLTLFNIGKSSETEDPFVGFASIVPLFELNEDGSRFVLSPQRTSFFAHEEFPARKSEKTFRIFCLGGSTVQGRPYSIETSFTTWLRIGLEQADPETNWEVVNCGGISYASYRLVPILEETLRYEPDLIILCTGHNEFLEDRTYKHLKQVPAWIEKPAHFLTSTRTVQLASSMMCSHSDGKTILQTEADATLDYKNGIAAFHRDEEWSHGVAVHFESNVLRMIHLAQANNVPILLLKPPSNLSGTPPFKSESALLTKEEISNVEEMKIAARRLYSSDMNRATDIWREICRIDPAAATNWYELGSCLDVQYRTEEAKSAYIAARDLDVCPLRMTTALESALDELAEKEDVPLIDLNEMLQKKTKTGNVGHNLFVDHVHPNFEGHQQIALAIGHWLHQQGYVQLNADWDVACQESFSEHFDALPRTYFHRGQRMLSALKKWTQGDADGIPVEKRFPHKFKK